jgi:hypothetical protein
VDRRGRLHQRDPRGPPAVEPTFDDGLQYMEMTEAIFRSIETGKWWGL